jgi:hypothetical protein
MSDRSSLRRPSSRIDYILPKLKYIWHYYPELSLSELVLTVTLEANRVKADLPGTDMYDIEDINYPKGHLCHSVRNLEMGIEELEKRHSGQPLPPVPIQTALLGKVAAYWRKRPQMRLGQLLSNAALLADLEANESTKH